MGETSIRHLSEWGSQDCIVSNAKLYHSCLAAITLSFIVTEYCEYFQQSNDYSLPINRRLPMPTRPKFQGSIRRPAGRQQLSSQIYFYAVRAKNHGRVGGCRPKHIMQNPSVDFTGIARSTGTPCSFCIVRDSDMIS